VQWYETQIRREVDSRESEAAKHAQQQEQMQASRDALQKQLAVTEAEFRLALQVMLPCKQHEAALELRQYSSSYNKLHACYQHASCSMWHVWLLLGCHSTICADLAQPPTHVAMQQGTDMHSQHTNARLCVCTVKRLSSSRLEHQLSLLVAGA